MIKRWALVFIVGPALLIIMLFGREFYTPQASSPTPQQTFNVECYSGPRMIFSAEVADYREYANRNLIEVTTTVGAEVEVSGNCVITEKTNKSP